MQQHQSVNLVWLFIVTLAIKQPHKFVQSVVVDIIWLNLQELVKLVHYIQAQLLVGKVWFFPVDLDIMSREVKNV